MTRSFTAVLLMSATLILLAGCQHPPNVTQPEIVCGEAVVIVPAYTHTIESGSSGGPHTIYVRECSLDLRYKWDTGTGSVDIEVHRINIPVDFSLDEEFRSGIRRHTIFGPYNEEIARRHAAEPLNATGLGFSMEERNHGNHRIRIECIVEAEPTTVGPWNNRTRADQLSIRFRARNELNFERRVVNLDETTIGTISFSDADKVGMLDLSSNWGSNSQVFATANVRPLDSRVGEAVAGSTRIDLTSYEQLKRYINPPVSIP